MFPKAKRGDPFRVASDAPGPGAYDMPDKSPPRPWRKGALGVYQADRFQDEAERPDNFGAYDTLKENNRGGNVQPVKATDQARLLARQEALHAKELARIQSKLDKSEDLRKGIAEERDAARSEAERMAKEARGTARREEALREEMNSLAQSSSDSASLRAELAANERAKVSFVRHSRADALTLRHRAEKAEETVRVANLARLRSFMDSSASRSQVEALLRALEDGNAARMLELLALEDSREETSWARKDAEWERSQRMNLASEGRELTRRAREAEREARRVAEVATALKAEATVEREARELADLLAESARDELDEVSRDRRAVMSERDELLLQSSALSKALGDANLALERARGETSEAAARNRELQVVLRAVEDERDAALGQIASREAELHEANAEIEKVKGEERRLGELVARLRGNETALREDLESANKLISTVPALASENAALSGRLDLMQRLNDAAEQDVAALSEANDALAGHANLAQKIRHVNHVREELAESKKAHVATESALAVAQREIAALKSELGAYRPVDSLAYSPSELPAATDSDVIKFLRQGGEPSWKRVSRSAAPHELSLVAETAEEEVPEAVKRLSRTAVPVSRGSRIPSTATAADWKSSSVGASAREDGAVRVGRIQPGGGFKMTGAMSISELF